MAEKDYMERGKYTPACSAAETWWKDSLTVLLSGFLSPRGSSVIAHLISFLPPSLTIQRARRTTAPASAWSPRTRTSTTRPSTASWSASPIVIALLRSCTPPLTATRSSPLPTPRSSPAMASRYVALPALPPSLPPSLPPFLLHLYANIMRLSDVVELLILTYPASLPPSPPSLPPSLGRLEELRRRLLHGPPDRPPPPKQARLGRGL